MLYVRARHHFWIFAVICYYYGNRWVVAPYAVDQVLELVIAQEGFGGYGDKSTDVVF